MRTVRVLQSSLPWSLRGLLKALVTSSHRGYYRYGCYDAAVLVSTLALGGVVAVRSVRARPWICNQRLEPPEALCNPHSVPGGRMGY